MLKVYEEKSSRGYCDCLKKTKTAIVHWKRKAVALALEQYNIHILYGSQAKFSYFLCACAPFAWLVFFPSI